MIFKNEQWIDRKHSNKIACFSEDICKYLDENELTHMNGLEKT